MKAPYRCSNCHTELNQVFEMEHLNRRREDNPNLVAVLRLDVHGGYAEYIDGKIDLIFCSKCAGQFLDLFPNIKSRFQEADLI